jgi:integrase
MARSPPPRPKTITDDRTSIVVKLTKRVIDEAVPAIVKGQPRARLLLDSDLSGFGIRIGIGKQRVKTFFAQRKVRGVVKRVSIDKYGTITVDEAREIARGMLVDMGKGIDHADEKRKARARGVTLQDALTAHIEFMHKKKRSPRTIADYEKILRKYSPDWMARELAGIDDADVEARHTRIARDVRAGKHAARLKHRQADGRRKGAVIKRSDATGETVANLWQRVFSVAYNGAKKRNKNLPANPAATVERFTIEREKRTISDTDLPRWWIGINSIPNEIKRDALKVALFTGLRRASVAALKWIDIDLDGATMHIRKPKGGRSFDLPLPNFLVDLLRKRREGNKALRAQGVVEAKNLEWVFPCTIANPSKKHGHLSELRHDIPGVTWSPHDARRCFSRVADSLDVSRFALKVLLNHSQESGGDVTSNYVSITTERLRRPMEQISERLLQLVEPKKAPVVPITKGRAKSKARR